MVGGRLGARLGMGEPVPVLGQDRLEDVPVPRGCCKPEGAPSASGPCAGHRFDHGSSAPSTPHRSSAGYPQPPPSSLHAREFRDPKNAISYTMDIRTFGLGEQRRPQGGAVPEQVVAGRIIAGVRVLGRGGDGAPKSVLKPLVGVVRVYDEGGHLHRLVAKAHWDGTGAASRAGRSARSV